MAGGFTDWLAGLDYQKMFPDYTAQRGQEGYIRGVPSFVGQNKVPAIWEMFAPYGEDLINKSAQAKLKAAASGIGGGRRELERELLAAGQNAGLDPVYGKAALHETAREPGERLATAQGEIEAERLGGLYEQNQGLGNMLSQSYLGERDMALQAYLASMGRKDARDAGQSALLSSLLGVAGSAAGGFFGGPGGAMVGGQLGQAFGGGQQPPYNPNGITGLTSR